MDDKPEFKLIVAGSRSFTDRDLLARVLIGMADVEFAGRELRILSSTEKGAPATALSFAKTLGIKTQRFPASWKGIGSKAGYIRDSQMCTAANAMVVFSDGKATESANLIALMNQQLKPVYIHNLNS